MGVARCRLGLRMTEELPTIGGQDSSAPIDANVCRRSCKRTPSSPARRQTANQGFLRSVRGPVGMGATDDVCSSAWMRLQDLERRRFNTIVSAQSLSRRQQEKTSPSRRAPTQVKNLSQPAPVKKQEASVAAASGESKVRWFSSLVEMLRFRCVAILAPRDANSLASRMAPRAAPTPPASESALDVPRETLRSSWRVPTLRTSRAAREKCMAADNGK